MRYNELLREYSRDKTAQALGYQAYARWAKEQKQPVYPKGSEEAIKWIDWLLGKLERSDPTPHHEYTQWLCKVYATGTVKMEDLISRGADALKRFNQLKIKKQLAPEHRDINRFKTFREFETAVASYPDVEQNVVDRGQYKEYYKDNDLRVIVPIDEKAACFWGQGTKWCTASKKNNMFNHYAKEGTIYIVIPTKTHHAGEKYQFHFESGQFMDDSDTQIDLRSWVKAYPQLKTIFHEQAKKNLTIPLLNNSEQIYEKFDEIKESVFYWTHSQLMHNIGTVVKGMFNDFRSHGVDAGGAHELVNTTYEAINNDSHGLVSNVLFRLTVDSIRGDDELWDTGYFACEDWVSGSDIGTMANEMEESNEVDTYGIVNTIANELYEKFVKSAAAKLKQEMRKYIE